MGACGEMGALLGAHYARALTSGVRVAYETRKFLHVNGTVAIGVVSLSRTHAHAHAHTNQYRQPEPARLLFGDEMEKF